MSNVADVFSLLDVTYLYPSDDANAIEAVCNKAVFKSHHVAAVCIDPSFVKQARALLMGSPVKVATVANFPKGQDPLSDVVALIHHVINEGADEIDVVFPYRAYLSGDEQYAFDFIQACRVASGQAVLLKVILETGALKQAVHIEKASEIACLAGADFLKTSTGKIAVGATVEAVDIMLSVIKRMPMTVGCKVAGGIRSLNDANRYIQRVVDQMGKDWLTPTHFRIGASQLVDEIIARLSALYPTDHHQ